MRRCPHRGFPIAENESFCRYHGFSQPFDCRLFESCWPHPNNYDDCIMEWIYSNLGEQFHSVEQKVRAPWYLWMQNTADFLHVPHVHAGGFAEQFSSTIPFDVRISSDMANSSHRLMVKKSIRLSYELMLGKKLSEYSFAHVLKYPNLSITSFLDVFYSLESAHAEDGGCVVKTKFYLSNKNPAPRALIRSAILANERTLEEDRVAMETWALGYRETGNWLNGEGRVRAFNVCLKQCEVI